MTCTRESRRRKRPKSKSGSNIFANHSTPPHEDCSNKIRLSVRGLPSLVAQPRCCATRLLAAILSRSFDCGAVLRSLHGSCHSGRLPAEIFSASRGLTQSYFARQTHDRDGSPVPAPKKSGRVPSTVPPVPLPPHCRQAHPIVALGAFGPRSPRPTGGAKRARGGAMEGTRQELFRRGQGGALPTVRVASKVTLCKTTTRRKGSWWGGGPERQDPGASGAPPRLVLS